MPRARNRVNIMQAAQDQMKKETKEDEKELDSGGNQTAGSTAQSSWSTEEEENTIRNAKQSREVKREARPAGSTSENVKRVLTDAAPKGKK